MDDPARHPHGEVELRGSGGEQQQVAIRRRGGAGQTGGVDRGGRITAADRVIRRDRRRDPGGAPRQRGQPDAIEPERGMPCSSRCAATVSVSACPPERALTNASNSGDEAETGAPASPCAISRTARCATALRQ